jgi:EAL domain-containing protein (putative c-di-GMP-specific phosphodiesterase class I)/putative methionine-R-sulfoxide reductase with GAF domain
MTEDLCFCGPVQASHSEHWDIPRTYEGATMGLREAIAIASDPASVMERVLAEALVLVPSADGAVIELYANRTSSLVITAARGNVADSVGSVLSVADSLSGLAMQSGVTQRCNNATTDPRVDAKLAAELEILSMICVPLRRGDERVGVLNITSSEASAFGTADEASLAGLAHFVSSMIGAAIELASCTAELLGPCQVAAAGTLGQGLLGGSSETARARSAFVANVVRPGTAFDSAVRDRIEQALTGAEHAIVVQPIVSLSSGRVVIVEALSRFAPPPARAPDRWFAEAASVGLGRPLELLAIERALSILPELPEPLRMAVNAGPDAFCSAQLLDLLSTSTPSRVIVELTEHVGIEDLPTLHRACKGLRTLGAEVAIDDTGTGFASLSLVLEVAPEFIKLDRELTGNIDLDPVRRSLARALVAFGNETGAEVIAEGIETAAELDVLIELGISYGQGFHLGRPGSLEDLAQLLRTRGQREAILV